MKLKLLYLAAILAAATSNPTYNSGQSEVYSGQLHHGQGDVAYQGSAEKNAKILDYKMGNDGHNYEYQYETDNGIKAQEVGQTIHGTQAQGGYSYTGDDGHVYTVTYTADENGFRASGDHLPTPPPIPEAIAKALEENAQAEANGVFDDGKYKPEAEESYQHYEENHQQNTEHHTSQPIQQTEHHVARPIQHTPVHHQISFSDHDSDHQISVSNHHNEHHIPEPSHHHNEHQISLPIHHIQQIAQSVQHIPHHVAQPLQHIQHHIAQPVQHIQHHVAQPVQHIQHQLAQAVPHFQNHVAQSIQNVPHPVPQIQRTEYYTHHPSPHTYQVHENQQSGEQQGAGHGQRVTYHIAQPINHFRGQPFQLAQRRNQMQMGPKRA